MQMLEDNRVLIVSSDCTERSYVQKYKCKDRNAPSLIFFFFFWGGALNNVAFKKTE